MTAVSTLDEAWNTPNQKEVHSHPVTREVESRINDALGLDKVILILPKELTKFFKGEAEKQGTVPQKLMRDAIFAFRRELENK